VFVNGIGQSWIPYGSVHSALGAVPAFIHPDPREAAIVGLGSGDTLYSLAGRASLSHVTCVEIIQPQLGTLRGWAQRSGYPALTAMLADPRIEHVYGDGRIHIMRSERRYDIIEADALRPTSAHSGHLYSAGYFELLRSRLAPGGLAVTWAPTSRVHDTFAAVFPHVLDFGHLVLGSNEPIRFSPSEVRARLQAPDVKAYYARAGINIEELLAPYLQGPDRVSDPRPRSALARMDLNEDLFPRDEFSVPRRQ
jgi:spermidine synthase